MLQGRGRKFREQFIINSLSSRGGGRGVSEGGGCRAEGQGSRIQKRPKKTKYGRIHQKTQRTADMGILRTSILQFHRFQVDQISQSFKWTLKGTLKKMKTLDNGGEWGVGGDQFYLSAFLSILLRLKFRSLSLTGYKGQKDELIYIFNTKFFILFSSRNCFKFFFSFLLSVFRFNNLGTKNKINKI